MQSIVNEKIKEYSLNLLQIPTHAHRILIIGGSGSGKAN